RSDLLQSRGVAAAQLQARDVGQLQGGGAAALFEQIVDVVDAAVVEVNAERECDKQRRRERGRQDQGFEPAIMHGLHGPAGEEAVLSVSRAAKAKSGVL